MTRKRFVVLDRDGTIIVERHYLADPRRLELISRVAESLHQLSEMGLGLVVVTNQSGIGRGLFDLPCLARIHQQLCTLLAAAGVHLDGIYFCPHTPEDDCLCRKPRTGLIELAAQELRFDPRTAFVIGDKSCDIELGQRVGATTFLVRTGYGAQVATDPTVSPDYVVDGVWEAAQVIARLLTTHEGRATDAVRS
jgi:D-glycero-D-manno-heptose 1,7-bisphosphate phosphatase